MVPAAPERPAADPGTPLYGSRDWDSLMPVARNQMQVPRDRNSSPAEPAGLFPARKTAPSWLERRVPGRKSVIAADLRPQQFRLVRVPVGACQRPDRIAIDCAAEPHGRNGRCPAGLGANGLIGSPSIAPRAIDGACKVPRVVPPCRKCQRPDRIAIDCAYRGTRSDCCHCVRCQRPDRIAIDCADAGLRPGHMDAQLQRANGLIGSPSIAPCRVRRARRALSEKCQRPDRIAIDCACLPEKRYCGSPLSGTLRGPCCQDTAVPAAGMPTAETQADAKP